MEDASNSVDSGFCNSERNGSPEGLTYMLDELEMRVEKFRTQAACLQQEKEAILRGLHILQHSEAMNQLSVCDRDMLEVNAERLICRCLTVEVSVEIPRNDAQEEALTAASTYLEKAQTQSEHKEERLRSLLSACQSEQVEHEVPADHKFQALLLGCTAEDQKTLHRRLQLLVQEGCSQGDSEKTQHSLSKVQNPGHPM